MKSEKEVLQLMRFQKSTLQWIQNMLLSDEMRLKTNIKQFNLYYSFAYRKNHFL